MNKTTFEVGKTYLTRDGSEAQVTSSDWKTLAGIVTAKSGFKRRCMWYHTGAFVFSGQPAMDLMPEATYENNSSIVESLKKENASLFKANIDLLAKFDALQRENTQLYVELQEARMIARGMVEALRQSSLDDPPMCKCNIYRAEDVHVCAFQRIFNKLTCDEKYCTCCEKCSADCVKLAKQGMVDAAKCGAFDRKL